MKRQFFLNIIFINILLVNLNPIEKKTCLFKKNKIFDFNKVCS